MGFENRKIECQPSLIHTIYTKSLLNDILFLECKFPLINLDIFRLETNQPN